ncbi:MAG: hypothetical protein OXI67_04485 [Candidatus Poribacteria bacterium]|nr:hypothetical protein [Candidatus Poribacteria bacterium]
MNKKRASIRIRVEHAISGVKRYCIVKDKLRNWKKGFCDLVMEICCGLHNFRPGVMKLLLLNHYNVYLSVSFIMAILHIEVR